MKQLKLPADDRYIRITFSDVNRMAGLLREFLPPDLTACLNLQQLKRLHEQQIDTQLRERRDDLNLECPVLPQGRAVVRVLVEHKSVHDEQLWLQLMRSILTYWEHSCITAVIPVVIHTGPEPFLFDTPAKLLHDLPTPLTAQLPNLPVCAIDLASITTERIWRSPNLDPVSKYALNILKLAQQDNLDTATAREALLRYPHNDRRRRRRIVQLALNYLHYKSSLPPEAFETLRYSMPLVHPVNPKSAFAMELRDKLTEGIALGELRKQIATIQNMLSKNYSWNEIAEITGVAEADFPALLKKAEGAGKQP